MNEQMPSKDRLSHALERVAIYRKDPDSLLPYARSMVALADEIERLERAMALATDVCREQSDRIADLKRTASEPTPHESKENIDTAFNRVCNVLGELFAGKQAIKEVAPQTLGCERYRLVFSGTRYSEVNEAMHDLGVAIRQYSAHEPPAVPTTPDELSRDIERKFMVAVMEADDAFEKVGATGTKTWIRDFLLGRLEANGIGIGMKDHVRRATQPPGAWRSALVDKPTESDGPVVIVFTGEAYSVEYPADVNGVEHIAWHRITPYTRPTKGSAPPPMDTPVDGVPGVTIAEYMRAAVASAMCGKCKQPYCICVPTQGEEVR